DASIRSRTRIPTLSALVAKRGATRRRAAPASVMPRAPRGVRQWSLPRVRLIPSMDASRPGHRLAWAAGIAAALSIVVGGGIASIVLFRGGDASPGSAQSGSAEHTEVSAIGAPSFADKEIAYVGSDGNLWTISPDGTDAQRLTSDGA